MNKKAVMLLIENVLSPLLEIVYLYKRSGAYNYVPDTKENCDAGWDYFENQFNSIYKGLNQNLFLTQNEYKKGKEIITEVKAFVRSFSYAEGLPERYFKINPNLRFYSVAFELQEEDDNLFYEAAANNMLAHVPRIDEFSEKKQYFLDKKIWNDENNFHYDKDDFFMDELSYTIHQVFLQDFPELL